MNKFVIIGVVATLILVLIVIVIGVMISQKKSDSSETSETSETPESPESSGILSTITDSIKSDDTKVITPPNLPVLATTPVISKTGTTSMFVPITAAEVPKSATTGKPAPAPKGTAWVGQKITASDGRTVTVPILAPTTAPKQDIVTKGPDGKPLGKLPKGMVWVRRTVKKGGKTVSYITPEKKL